jgi:hypothetical protein
MYRRWLLGVGLLTLIGAVFLLETGTALGARGFAFGGARGVAFRGGGWAVSRGAWGGYRGGWRATRAAYWNRPYDGYRGWGYGGYPWGAGLALGLGLGLGSGGWGYPGYDYAPSSYDQGTSSYTVPV